MADGQTITSDYVSNVVSSNFPDADPDYVNATIQAESSYNPNAISHNAEGKPIAYGLTQDTPKTGFAEFKKLQAAGKISQDETYNPLDPEQNIKVGTSYLSSQEEAFKGDKRLISAAYNAGPERVKQLQAEHGDTYEDIAAYLPGETQKYVARVAGNYNKLRAARGSDNEAAASPNQTDTAKNADLLSTIKSAPPNADGFAKSTAMVTEDPDFATLPFTDQAKKITQIYNAKDWSPRGYDAYKQTMASLWNAADPNETPDISQIVGAPPIVQPGQNPADVLNKWRSASTQKLLRSGLTPAFFGGKLEDYFTNASKAETEAFGARNEGWVQSSADLVGNTLRGGAKGLLRIGTDPVAAIVRMYSLPANAYFDKTSELSDADKASVDTAQKRAEMVMKIPELLGAPSNPSAYATNPNNGTLRLNPDGTPQLKAQQSASQIADSVGGAIAQGVGLLAGGWGLKAAGASATVASLAVASDQALTFANSSYNTVYKDTGDARKAMTASLMAAPLGFVGELGAFKVISQDISPVIQELTAADKAMYVARSLLKKGATNAAIGVGMDATQQAAELLQSGKDYNTGRTIETGAISGTAGALVGSLHDWVTGQVGSVAQGRLKTLGDAALADFRNSTDGTRTINVPAVSKDLVDTFGMDVVSNNNGTVTVTKRGYVVPEGQTIDALTKTLATTYSSDDIKDIGAKQAALSVKENRTPEEAAQLTRYNQILGATSSGEYQNGVKAIERAIEDHPDRFGLGVYRDASTNLWEHPINGQSLALKDVLITREPEYTKDLSDISKLKILDEDAIKNRTLTQEPINPQGHEDEINIRNELRKLDSAKKALEVEKLQLPEAPIEGEDPYAQRRSEIQDSLKQNDILRKKQQIELNKVPPLTDIEKANLETQKKEQKTFKDQQTSDLKDLNKIRKGRSAEYTSGTHTIRIRSHDTPQAKVESTAHELAHAIEKDLGLSDAATAAIKDEVKNLEAMKSVSKIKDLVNRVFLPHARARLLKNVPEDAAASTLDRVGNKEAKDAIFKPSEILAHQVGAIMLKRAGFDIGDFKILPEVKASLRKTKLPDVNEVLNPQKETVNAPEKQATKQTSNAREQKNATINIIERPTENAVVPGTDQVSNPEPPRFNTETGEVGETRFSKKVRAVNPNIPATEYNRVSEALGREQAGAHIDKHGMEETQKYLSTDESFKMEPKDRSALVEELFARRQAEFNAKSTPKTAYDLTLAEQLRAKAGTAYAQGLGVLRKFRNSETFADLVGNINRAYIDAGMKPPEYTQAMIDELRGNFEKADKLPKGSRARDTEVDNIFTKTLGFNKTNWGTFLAKYARTNLLSGLGTQLVVANSSLYMGPVLTALAHPFQGGGLIWRAMWQAKGLAASNARAVFAGEGGKALFNGIYDPSPVAMGEKPSVESGFAKLYSYYGDKFLNALAATHSYAKTLSAEGFLANRGYNELKAQYGNDPAKFSAEVSKLILNPKDIEAAKAQATREYQDAGIKAKPGAIGARAYEILRTQSNTPEQLATAEEYAKGVSHAGEMANVSHQMALEFFNAKFFQNPFLRPVKFIVQPFGRAMLALSDYAIDYIPGNIAIDPAIRRLGNALDRARGGEGDYFKPRSEALQTRLRNAQAVGAVMSATLLGLSRSGLFTITGDEEKSDVEGEGKDFAGGQASNRADFAEAKQKGVPAYSIVFKNGFSIDYKDLPGFNALAYGLYRVNKSIDDGEGIGIAATKFYKGAFAYALPFFGGGTLNSPMYTLGQAILNPEVDPKKAGDAVQASAERWTKFYQQSADTTEKFLVPFSSLLRDIQQVYDQPEESHQAAWQRTFRNVPGVSSLVGSQNAVDRFGDPVQRTGLEHAPGVGRLVGEVTPESGVVWDKLNAKGLIVKEMGNYINFHKADLGTSDRFEAYQKNREERIGSAYAKTLTPDEWNQFRAATGPYIKAVANNIADADLPHDTAQETLTKRINAIEEQSLKRYVATGHF